ncbi:response regulator [Aquicella lusitana]|uniref:Response regulator receiver domain-containing protein n=1 Tax=Aquicella lusitana TaxID=254246 RepID=A0A370GQN2_9COXI|nr:response regulator [Aquicella lusitana]RDI46025.1 response regulator receiver domain-containing protein [Aquicella lusitana]VVC73378.1 Sporulation initiation phosphotransferase F [Aquicella lusitana]
MAKILLVEDDELVRDMLMQVLQRASHTVLCAANGEEATEYLQKDKPDIMVTDIIMPKKSGITLISEVKNRHPNLEIIAISGGGRLDPTGYLDLSESLGASVSFEKPIDNTALLMAIDLLLHGKKEKTGSTTNH